MVARFGHPGEHYPAGAPSAASVAAARRALQCAPLKSYLHAITAPLTLGQAFSNIVHATTYTTMSFSPDPTIAYQQLCHPKRKGST
jgi:hypothetical protein